MSLLEALNWRYAVKRGFIPAEVDKILELREKGLRSVAILALGYRDIKNDYLVNAKKVRKPMNEFIIEPEMINVN